MANISDLKSRVQMHFGDTECEKLLSWRRRKEGMPLKKYFIVVGFMVLLLLSDKLVIGLIQPDLLVVMRKDSLHQLAKSDFSKRIEDSQQVTELYRKLLDLPVFPKGTTSCPADNGVQYELVFFKRNQLVATATVNASGCQGVTMDNKVYWAMEPKGNGFRTLLEHALGLSDSAFQAGFASR